ncbi:MAG: PIG-L family deacetylase, partial [Chitinophagaceae bacterium]
MTPLKRFIFSLIYFLCFPIFIYAQQSQEWNAAQIRLHLGKLNVLGSVLFVAAHPDDENSRLLAFLSNGELYRTGYLSMTRGDGGQNLLGDEQGSLLGLIRTQELLAARQIDGAEQFFTRANDFGFSKTSQETLKFWGNERILGDVVWVIRKFRPDVIICRFPPDKRAGHGHHAASAILAHEAFLAAADPKQFPEQLKYVHPWQAKRILWNTYHFGQINTTSPEQFKVDVGAFNPLLGEGYGELAADSRSMHKSQGFGVPRMRGAGEEYFETVAGTSPKISLMDGVNTTWSRVKGGAEIGVLVNQAIQGYQMEHPENSIPELLKIFHSIQQLHNQYWKEEKSSEIKRLILACGGIWMDADASSPTVAPGNPLNITC